MLPADDFSGHHLIEKGEMSPVKNLEPNDFQSNQLLHLVECMQDASEKQSKQHTRQNSQRTQSHEEKDMQRRIIFSAELTKSEEEGPVSSPEMDLLT